MTFGKWGKVAVAALGVAALSSAVFAQDKETLVKNRVDFMKGQAADNKAIGDYAKGMATKEAATKAINDLVERSGKIVAMFPAGTSSTDMPGKSNAKAAIWTDHDKFVAIAKTLHDTAVAEADVIKTGTPEEVGAAQANLGKVGCGACHGPYREKLPG
jgi:cytochrome c556